MLPSVLMKTAVISSRTAIIAADIIDDVSVCSQRKHVKGLIATAIKLAIKLTIKLKT